MDLCALCAENQRARGHIFATILTETSKTVTCQILYSCAIPAIPKSIAVTILMPIALPLKTSLLTYRSLRSSDESHCAD